MGGENLLGYNGPSIVNLTINQTPCSAAVYRQRLPQLLPPDAAGITRTGSSIPSNFSTADHPHQLHAGRLPHLLRAKLAPHRSARACRNLVLDVAYVGNRSNGLMILGDYNQARPNNPGENLTLTQRRPIQASTTSRSPTAAASPPTTPCRRNSRSATPRASTC